MVVSVAGRFADGVCPVLVLGRVDVAEAVAAAPRLPDADEDILKRANKNPKVTTV